MSPSAVLVSLLSTAALAEPAVSLELEAFSTRAAARVAADAASRRFNLALASPGAAPDKAPPDLEGPAVQVYGAGRKWHVSLWVGSGDEVPRVRELLGNPRGVVVRTLERELVHDSMMVIATVHVLWKDSGYLGAVARAKRAARSLHRPYTTRGHVWSSETGLVTPDDGTYEQRRDNACEEGDGCISVEPARAFGGPAGEYWVVGAVTVDEGETLTTASLLEHAEQKLFWFYTGCMH